MNPRWLFRMAKWAHTPPGTQRVMLVLGIAVLCLIVFGIERFIGLPDWMTVDPTRKGRFPTQ